MIPPKSLKFKSSNESKFCKVHLIENLKFYKCASFELSTKTPQVFLVIDFFFGNCKGRWGISGHGVLRDSAIFLSLLLINSCNQLSSTRLILSSFSIAQSSCVRVLLPRCDNKEKFNTLKKNFHSVPI